MNVDGARRVFFQQDIRRNIVAVAVAMLSSAAANGAGNLEYCRGVLDTSRAQSLNHGMRWSEVLAEIREALEEEHPKCIGLLLGSLLPLEWSGS